MIYSYTSTFDHLRLQYLSGTTSLRQGNSLCFAVQTALTLFDICALEP